MAADGAADETCMRQPVEAPVLSVAGGSSEDQAEVTRCGGLQEAPLQSREQDFGGADADEARAADDIPILNQRDGLLCRGDLVADHGSPCDAGGAHQSRFLSQSTMPLPSTPCDLPLTNTPTWPPSSPISV